MKIQAHEIKEGDLIDLEGDPYADPNCDHGFEFEYQLVIAVDQETPECVAITFEGFDIVGFPTNHMLEFGGSTEL